MRWSGLGRLPGGGGTEPEEPQQTNGRAQGKTGASQEQEGGVGQTPSASSLRLRRPGGPQHCGA